MRALATVGGEQARRLDAVQPGMRTSMRTTSGRSARLELHRLDSVGRRPDDREVVLRLEQRGETGPTIS